MQIANKAFWRYVYSNRTIHLHHFFFAKGNKTKYSAAVNRASLNNFEKQITDNSYTGKKETNTRLMICCVMSVQL
jgi:hypothetical protein